MRNRKPSIAELLAENKRRQQEADRIIARQHPADWPVKDLKSDKIEESTDQTLAMVIGAGLPGSMFGCMGGAAVAGSLELASTAVYGAAVTGFAAGFAAGMWAAHSLPCSPFRDDIRVGELRKEYVEAEKEIAKLKIKSD